MRKLVPYEEFVRVWNKSDSSIQVAARLGIPRLSVLSLSVKLRRKGFKLKAMKQSRPTDPVGRILSRCDKVGECLICRSGGDGYAVVFSKKFKKGRMVAHRFMYEAFYKKKIPKGMLVCHKCDNKKCVNPKHLFIGTPKQNTQDMIRKGRGMWQKNAPTGRKRKHAKA